MDTICYPYEMFKTILNDDYSFEYISSLMCCFGNDYTQHKHILPCSLDNLLLLHQFKNNFKKCNKRQLKKFNNLEEILNIDIYKRAYSAYQNIDFNYEYMIEEIDIPQLIEVEF
jgi:hypothetical protein